jgi:hypothetical protein
VKTKAFRQLNEDEEDQNEGENSKEEVDKEEGIGDICLNCIPGVSFDAGDGQKSYQAIP